MRKNANAASADWTSVELKRAKTEQVVRGAAADPGAQNRIDRAAHLEEDEYSDEKKRLEIANLRQDITLRKEFAAKISRLTWYWIAGVFVLLLGVGSYPTHRAFYLPDGVLIASVASTAVPGLLAIVLRYLFPHETNQDVKNADEET